MDLANALTALAEREPETQWLQEAIELYHAALEENTRERVPLRWAKTLTNLGIALSASGLRTRNPDQLASARACLLEARSIFVEAGMNNYLEIVDDAAARTKDRQNDLRTIEKRHDAQMLHHARVILGEQRDVERSAT